MATVVAVKPQDTNLEFEFEVPFGDTLKVDQSLAHNGVCLTVTAVEGKRYSVTAIAETLQRTNLGALSAGMQVNVERCLLAGARLDGHIVQGHVDGMGTVSRIVDRKGSWGVYIEHSVLPGWVTVPKGSICVNGVSLTVVESREDGFSVELIPYTWEHTNLSALREGSSVNLEFDILGKYASRLMGAYLENLSK